MKKNREKFRILILSIGILIGVILIGVIFFTGTTKNVNKVPLVGYVMTGSIDEIGWNEMNYLGLKAACDKYNCRLITKENVLEHSGQCRNQVIDLINKKASIIILSSASYSDEIKDLILENKNIIFFSNYASFEAPNLSMYFVRMYQVRYLTGIIAGATTKTDEIGYIAPFNTNEVNRGISAFTLGVKRVNKNARVILQWTDDWDNETIEKQAVKNFAENTNVDIIAYHQNKPTIVYEADKYGINSISYHTDERSVSHCLASIVCDWTEVYGNILKNGLNTPSYHENYYWLGMEDNVLQLPYISDVVDNITKIKIDSIKTQLSYGFNIFSGLIYDTKGNIRCVEDEALSDSSLLDNFDWLVQGVEYYVE